MLLGYNGMVAIINKRATHISDPSIRWTTEEKLEFCQLLDWFKIAMKDQLENFLIDIIKDTP